MGQPAQPRHRVPVPGVGRAGGARGQRRHGARAVQGGRAGAGGAAGRAAARTWAPAVPRHPDAGGPGGAAPERRPAPHGLAAAQVDPKSEISWDSWIATEADLGRVEAADELRIRRAEQQWEFVVPPGFTTRPAPGLVEGLIRRFFAARGGEVADAQGPAAELPGGVPGVSGRVAGPDVQRLLEVRGGWGRLVRGPGAGGGARRQGSRRPLSPVARPWAAVPYRAVPYRDVM